MREGKRRRWKWKAIAMALRLGLKKAEGKKVLQGFGAEGSV